WEESSGCGWGINGCARQVEARNGSRIVMKCWAIAALVVAAVGSPLPHEDCKHEIITYSGAVPIGSLHAGHYVAVPAHHYQAAYSVGAAPAVVSYAAAPASSVSHVLHQSVQPTPEVQRETAAFMAAWNEAAARATQIQRTLVRSAPSGTYSIQIPKQVEATEEVKRATAQFMAAWNKAARRATVVEQAVYSLPQPVQPTEDVQRATAEFMAEWERAAQQASAIRQAVSYSATPYSGVPRQVEATDEVKRATEEFLAAWNKAAARVPTIQTTLYHITGTTPSSGVPTIVGGVPQFTPEVAHATAEFTKVWNAAAAAAAAAPDVNIIMGSRSHSGYHHAPAAVSYAAASFPASSYALPQPVQPTPEVQSATAAFMAAWNAAAQRATKLQATLVKSGDTVELPRQVKETDAVKQATAEFMAAYNAAARRATVVEQAVSTLPRQISQTADVEKATAEFMAAWHAAAQRVSTLRDSVSTAYSAPQQVKPTPEVQRATAEFTAAWNEAAARIPKIETTLYTLSGSAALDSARSPQPVSDTPEVKAAKEAFLAKFRAAEAAATRASRVRGVLPVPTVWSATPIQHIAYSGGALHQTYSISDRIFAPFSGQPIYLKDCPH
ncbi:hypothetical protein OTU49_000596, partial [Cherax quadricarinatus]